ncbi:MAG: substrate-binding domain-containing protein [Lachnospiraceae bacterium]|nr:substrate-binding domain-containing protein [Lachnospiraceae bacterium]
MKKKIIRVLAAVLTAMLTVAGSGCGSMEAETMESQGETENKIQIGMCFDSFVIERWQRDRDVFVSTAKELGAEVNVQNANGDVEEQIRQVEYFIEKKMDVIVIICIDSDSLKDVVKKAQDEGIKIIAYDRLIRDADVDLYISFDNERVGTMMGEALVRKGLSGGRVLMIGGPLADNNVPLVENGFRKVMKQYNIEVIDSIHVDGWKPELGAAYVYEHPYMVEQADAIMCGNDSVATQVVHALSEKRLAGKIAVVGQDADLEACQRIVEGTQVMTVYKPVEKLAQTAAECAIALAEGEQLTPDTVSEITGNRYEAVMLDDGTYQVPYVGLEPVSVDRDNIDTAIIGSGFHLKEDVYLNVPDQMPK